MILKSMVTKIYDTVQLLSMFSRHYNYLESHEIGLFLTKRPLVG